MKNIALLLWLIVHAVISNAQQVVATSNLNLRSGPSTDTSVVYQIPRGTNINLNNCQSAWCEISVAGHTGYVAKRYTVSVTEYKTYQEKSSQDNAELTGPVKYSKNSKGNTVQSPTRYSAPPDGATAECRDGTYSFSQSRRGTCSHHEGVKRWLK